jgi:hypothetical protein
MDWLARLEAPPNALPSALGEMDFVAKVRKHDAGDELKEPDGGPFAWLDRTIG